MLAKRIIPCLDIKDGRTVKGVNFQSLRDAGDPVELGKKFAAEGADELVFLDITATHEKRKTLVKLVEQVAETLNIPFTVGGGVSSVDDGRALLGAGADKIGINSAAVRDPSIVDTLAKEFGSQCIVVSIDSNNIDHFDWVFINGGRVKTERKTLEWAKEVKERGAGEILITSMDKDGTKDGFALELTATLSSQLSIPIIASGGAGTKEHFADAFTCGKADAALAASVFHFGEILIPELKRYLEGQGICVRI